MFTFIEESIADLINPYGLKAGTVYYNCKVDKFVENVPKIQDRISISVNDFKVNDICLFLPSVNTDRYQAFNISTPYYFLEKGVDNKRPFVVARVLQIEQFVASNGNDLGLKPNTKYKQVKVKKIYL